MTRHNGNLHPLWDIVTVGIQNINDLGSTEIPISHRQHRQGRLIDAIIDVKTVPAFGHHNSGFRQGSSMSMWSLHGRNFQNGGTETKRSIVDRNQAGGGRERGKSGSRQTDYTKQEDSHECDPNGGVFVLSKMEVTAELITKIELLAVFAGK